MPQTRSVHELEHQEVLARRGPRSGAAVLVAVHSTARGPALGGCRLWHYENWRDGFEDVLRLAAGMTRKAAVAGLAFGGGKTVVALPPGGPLSGRARHEVLLDVGDAVASLSGQYVTGPDVGTDTEDMAVIAERTEHVLCTPARSGDSSPATAAATIACLERSVEYHHGSRDLAGRAVTVLGLGHVGALLVRDLVHAGAQVLATDTDPVKQNLATRLGARWTDPQDAAAVACDVLVPAALGWRLRADDVDELQCDAVVGPADDQLADDDAAEALHQRGVLWAPDYLVGAGGVVHATAIEVDRATPAEAERRVRALAETWRTVLEQSRDEDISPHRVARRLVDARLAAPAR